MSSPIFILPDCWNDDVRMAALFAVPRNEALNPHDWAGKYKFWKELILLWASHNSKVLINVEDLKKAFQRNGKYPASLVRVLEEMSNQGDLMLKSSCVSESQSSWMSWGVGLVKSSLVWSWNRVMKSLTEAEDQGVTSYVVPSVLKDKCERILQLPLASSEEVIDLEELTESSRDLFPDMEETQILINNLQKMGKVIVETSSSQTMIKFVDIPTTKAKSKAVQLNSSWTSSPVSKEKQSAEITEVDRSLATLKRTERLLTDEINDVEEEMRILEQTARTRLKEGARGAAKAALYRRKQLQAIFDKRNQALVNIQTLKLQLVQSKTDSKVMEAYKMGLSALKQSLSDLPLNEEGVQDTLVELESVLEEHRDIENTLAHGITSTEETESDLEEELKMILAAEGTEEEPDIEAELLNLPTVPAGSPKAAVETPSRVKPSKLSAD